MTIYLGADHRGFALKEKIKKVLADEGRTVEDLGAHELVPDDDYPQYGRAVAEKVAADAAGAGGARGIVVCGSGVGMDIAANRVKGVRAALALSADHVSRVRHDDDVNVLALAADFTNEDAAMRIVKAFLETSFDGGTPRYARRVEELDA